MSNDLKNNFAKAAGYLLYVLEPLCVLSIFFEFSVDFPWIIFPAISLQKYVLLAHFLNTSSLNTTSGDSDKITQNTSNKYKQLQIL